MSGQVEDMHHSLPDSLLAEALDDRHNLNKSRRAAVPQLDSTHELVRIDVVNHAVRASKVASMAQRGSAFAQVGQSDRYGWLLRYLSMASRAAAIASSRVPVSSPLMTAPEPPAACSAWSSQLHR